LQLERLLFLTVRIGEKHLTQSSLQWIMKKAKMLREDQRGMLFQGQKIRLKGKASWTTQILYNLGDSLLGAVSDNGMFRCFLGEESSQYPYCSM